MLGDGARALPSPRRARAPASRPSAPPASATARVEALSKLTALRDGGVLTDEQFAAERARLLAE